MNSAPSSIAAPDDGSDCVKMRPPIRSRASSTVTESPACPSSTAAASPAAPAPTTITSAEVIRIWS